MSLDHLSELKDFLSEPKQTIKLHDFVTDLTKQLVSEVVQEKFGIQGPITNASYVERLHDYEQSIEKLLPTEILIGRWGYDDNQSEIAAIPLRRLANGIAPMGGNTYLLGARWYPVFLLLYAGCIGATAGNNYATFYRLLHAMVKNPFGHKHQDILLMGASAAMTDIQDGFKLLPGLENRRAPRSEYIYTFLEKYVEDTLYLGTDYEHIFDRSEILMFAEYVHINHPEPIAPGEHVWSPIGRFIYKNANGSPLRSVMSEASATGDRWQPLRAGLFGGSSKRFIELAESLCRLSDRAGW